VYVSKTAHRVSAAPEVSIQPCNSYSFVIYPSAHKSYWAHQKPATAAVAISGAALCRHLPRPLAAAQGPILSWWPNGNSTMRNRRHVNLLHRADHQRT
jgi:hypothetical protein